MTKKIEIVLERENIVIKCDDREKKINHENFEINAYDIYELLDYKLGDIYEVETRCEKEDKMFPILEELKELFIEINDTLKANSPDSNIDPSAK